MSQRTLRIIGGKWRSRKVTFPDRADIRPTPDRVRETLFNWLRPHIAGSRCLELYAGSGVLSMEALSRGAKHVTVIEQDAVTWQSMKHNLTLLCDNPAAYECAQASALDWLENNRQQFDIVFIDPPFDSSEVEKVLDVLSQRDAIADDGLVYLETPAAVEPDSLPPQLSIVRQKQAGQVHYCLCERQR